MPSKFNMISLRKAIVDHCVGIVALLVLIIGCSVVAWRFISDHVRASDRVEFSRDIRPILNQNCVACHGGVRQKNDVSFIYRDEALGVGKSGHRTIVPGNPDASELMKRITLTDPEARMPYHTPALPPQQVELLRKWIMQGAHWEDYWSFVPPRAQPLPKVGRLDWVRQPLDRFVLARLEKEGLEPSPEADKAGRPTAGFAALRRTLGLHVARPGALCRHQGV